MAYRAGWIIGVAAAGLLSGCGDKQAPGAPSAGDAGKPAAAKADVVLDAGSMPKRKAGLWEQKMIAGDVTQVSRICVDAETETKLNVMGQGMSKEMCQQIDMKRRFDGSIAFSSVCDMGGGVGKITSKGLMTGDFNSAYKMTADSVTEGAAMAQANGPSSLTMEATYQGPCPAGFKPGDMEVNGMKMNLLAMSQAAKKN